MHLIIYAIIRIEEWLQFYAVMILTSLKVNLNETYRSCKLSSSSHRERWEETLLSQFLGCQGEVQLMESKGKMAEEDLTPKEELRKFHHFSQTFTLRREQEKHCKLSQPRPLKAR